MTITVERPAELVDDYHGIGLRWWADKVVPHGIAHRCITCADLRRYRNMRPLPIVIGRRSFPSLPVERRP